METTNVQRGFPWKGLLAGCGVVCLAGFALMCGGMYWIMSGHEGGVRLSNEMEDYATEYLAEHDILNSTESLIAYYDVTIRVNGAEAAILTTERIIYHKGGNTTAIPLAEITEIRHRTEPLIGEVIEIDSRSGIPMKIEIAPFNQGESFLSALQDAWERSK